MAHFLARYSAAGTLIIDFVDAKTNRQVWRGVAVGVIDQNRKAEQWDAVIDNAIRLIFKRLPFKPLPAPQVGVR